MFTAALLTTAKTWKQPKCPLTEDWIKKIWYVYTVGYCSAIKENEIMPFAASQWTRRFMFSEMSYKDKYFVITYVESKT